MSLQITNDMKVLLVILKSPLLSSALGSLAECDHVLVPELNVLETQVKISSITNY